MNSDRIKEIQEKTAYPASVSVQQALMQVWREVLQEPNPNVRNVVVYGWKRTGKCSVQHKEVIGQGIFRKFGCNFEEFEGGPGNYSTAIVEMPDGSVQNVPVGMITFIRGD